MIYPEKFPQRGRSVAPKRGRWQSHSPTFLELGNRVPSTSHLQYDSLAHMKLKSWMPVILTGFHPVVAIIVITNTVVFFKHF